MGLSFKDHESALAALVLFAMAGEGNTNSGRSILNSSAPCSQRAQRLHPAKMPCQDDLAGGKRAAGGEFWRGICAPDQKRL